MQKTCRSTSNLITMLNNAKIAPQNMKASLNENNFYVCLNPLRVCEGA